MKVQKDFAFMLKGVVGQVAKIFSHRYILNLFAKMTFPHIKTTLSKWIYHRGRNCYRLIHPVLPSKCNRFTTPERFWNYFSYPWRKVATKMDRPRKKHPHFVWGPKGFLLSNVICGQNLCRTFLFPKVKVNCVGWLMNQKRTLKLLKSCTQYLVGNRKCWISTWSVDNAHIVPWGPLEKSWKM